MILSKLKTPIIFALSILLTIFIVKFYYDDVIKTKDRTIESFRYTSEVLDYELFKYEIVLEKMKQKDSIWVEEFERKLQDDKLIEEYFKNPTN